MAIRFVNVEPEGEKRADVAAVPPARASGAGREEVTAEGANALPSGQDTPLPGLPHAKPEPKARGRKKTPAGETGQAAQGDFAAPLLDGLLPELQAHAKPTPKPRGRKTAFG